MPLPPPYSQTNQPNEAGDRFAEDSRKNHPQKHGWPSLDMLAFAHMVGEVFNNNPESTPTHSVPSRPATLNLQLVILPRRSLFGVYGFTLPCTVIPLQRIFN